MGYSRSPAVVERELPHLGELIAGRACAWHVDPPDRLATERFLTRLRQALAAARYNAVKFPELARAAERFSLHYIRDGLIEARPKSDSTKSVLQSSVPVSSGAVQGRPVSTVNKSNALAVVQAWDAHLPSSDPLNFPGADLSEAELTRLYHWAKSNVPKLMLLVAPGILTVSLLEAGAEAIEWRPADLSTPTAQLETEDGIDID